MKRSMLFGGAIVIAAASFALGAETRKSFVDAYSGIADAILGAKKAEAAMVRAVLDHHYRTARNLYEAGKFDEAAAEMALFANEGDNAVGGVRKRLLDGGHHHNAEGEEKGVYEAGYVIVTKAVKKAAMNASADLQSAKHDKGRKQAWDAFEAAAGPLVTDK